MNHWTALKSGWKAGLRQFRKRLTELRKAAPKKHEAKQVAKWNSAWDKQVAQAPTSGVPLIIESSGRVYGPDEWPIKDQPASLTVPIKGPQDHAS
jgi:hypothetical protein